MFQVENPGGNRGGNREGRSGDRRGSSNFGNNRGVRGGQGGAPRHASHDNRRPPHAGGNRPGGNRPSGGGRFGPTRRRGAPMDDSRYLVDQIEAANYRRQHMPVAEQPVAIPITHKFADFALNSIIKSNIAHKGFVAPTPIQDQGIIPILEGKDFLGIANTGTGKTGAFLIPLLELVASQKVRRVLIMVPTRELAQQIETEFNDFGHGTRLNAVLCIGGDSIGRQMSGLRSRPQFVIGTPGRLKDLINRRALVLEEFNAVVLDEVDRMLDMGFIADIKYIIAKLSQERQSMFFSATMNREIEDIIKMLLKPDYVKVSVKTGETADNVEQKIVRVKDNDEKLVKLEEILNQEKFTKMLIFVRTKSRVDRLDKFLFGKKYQVASIHGDRTQTARKKAMDALRAGKVNILIATDLAARGIDVADITHVINFDAPNTYADYVHRIGRTGRANRTGVAYTFVEI